MKRIIALIILTSLKGILDKYGVITVGLLPE